MLTAEALEFLAFLHRNFETGGGGLLDRRAARQAQFDEGALPDFLAETREIRQGNWTIGPIPADLLDRRVEITGPTDRKMIINALNSGAPVFMTDFEDSNSPTFANMVEGQINLIDRWQGTLDFTDPQSGKHYIAEPQSGGADGTAAGLASRREASGGRRRADGRRACSTSGFIFSTMRRRPSQEGSGPYFYLPKMESHREARLWNDVFIAAQDVSGCRRARSRRRC